MRKRKIEAKEANKKSNIERKKREEISTM